MFGALSILNICLSKRRVCMYLVVRIAFLNILLCLPFFKSFQDSPCNKNKSQRYYPPEPVWFGLSLFIFVLFPQQNPCWLFHILVPPYHVVPAGPWLPSCSQFLSFILQIRQGFFSITGPWPCCSFLQYLLARSLFGCFHLGLIINLSMMT